MIKKDYPIKELLSFADVANCVKGHLERAGSSVKTVHKYGIGVSINAIKDKENFMVEAVGEGESSGSSREKEILCAIGEVVRKMKKRGRAISMELRYRRAISNF